jgi:hypothetical protein
MKNIDFESFKKDLFEGMASKSADTLHDIRNVLAMNQCLNGLQQDEILAMFKGLYDYKVSIEKQLRPESLQS